MRVDLDKIAAQVARRKAQEALFRPDPEAERRRRLDELVTRSGIPFAPLLEGRLLANIVCDPAVHAICEVLLVEVDDFAHFPHQWIYRAFRSIAPSWSARSRQSDIQWWNQNALPVIIESIGLALENMDAAAERDTGSPTRTREKCDDLLILELLSRHALESYGPPGEPIGAWVEHDARQLRQLAEWRRSL